MIPAIALAVHALAIVPLAWSERELTRLAPGTGKQFVESLGTSWMSRYQVGESPAIVLEDGVPLPCPNAPPEAIAESGGGGFILADGNVYLSARDNSDPRTNGRRYTLRWPSPPPGPPLVAFAITGLIAVAGIAFLLWEFRAALMRVLAQPSFALSAAMFAVPFVLHRAWALVDVPLPGIQLDTGTYYRPVQELLAGAWPHFEVRPPAYPLLLTAVLSLTHNLSAMIWVQTLISAAAALVLIYGVHRLRPAASPWVALAMAAATTSFWPLQHDSSILSDSLYANAIVFAFGFVIWALASGSSTIFAAASAAIGLAILTRPAGLFLAVPFVLVLAYMWHTGRRGATWIAFALPFPALMLALALYNWSVAGMFTVTAWGEANLAVATFTFWEPDPSYPPEVNATIADISRIVGVTDAERSVRDRSWSPSVLAPIFLKGFTLVALDRGFTLGGGFAQSRAWLTRISMDSIRKHPGTYARFVSSMAYMYYIDNIRWHADFVNYVNGRALMLLTPEGIAEQRRQPLIGDMVRDFFVPSPRLQFVAGDACANGGAAAIVPTIKRRLYRVTQRFHDLVFARTFFIATFAAAFAFACYELFHANARHDVAFVVVLLGLSVIGSGVLVCLVEYAGHRYSYPTEFAVYVSTALAPWLARARG